ncbi:putative protein-lysine deacylase ABHD14B [Corticium candelabrum]|uniref:putative protein-lysine deacylase ABHD14B n=1 Tax=Corticium candelabrum TaxID=121492 RepID=UPI002E31D147|nr:putative protein-lysine deacylase ABHD14B [Corticium candelabrum]
MNVGGVRVILIAAVLLLFLIVYFVFGRSSRDRSVSMSAGEIEPLQVDSKHETPVPASCSTDAVSAAFTVKTSEVSKPEWSGSGSMFYRRATPTDIIEKVLPVVVLLHGAAFSSKTWLDLGTLEMLSCNGYESFAFDLPSKGQSEGLTGVDADGLVRYLRDKFQWKYFVIISPSMSGRYSLPFVTSGDTRGLVGFVPVAPGGVASFKSKMPSVDVKTLYVRGENDKSLGVTAWSVLREIKGAADYVMKGAGHACYMDNPDEFHKVLLKFLEQIVLS